MGTSYFQVLFDYKGKTYVGKLDLSERRTGNLLSVTCFPIHEPHKSRPLFFSKATDVGENWGDTKFSFGFIE